MKNLFYLLPFFAIALMMQSCDEDPVVAPLNPDIRFDSGAGITSGNATVAADSTITVRLTGSMGDNELNGLTIQEDGSNIAISKITIDGAAAPSAALLLQGTSRQGFTVDITIAVGDVAGTNAYSFILTDANNLSDEVSLNVTVEIPDVPATLAFSEESGYFFMDGEAVPNQLFKVKLIATSGSGELNSLSVLRDDVAMDAGDIFFNKIDSMSMPFVENPMVLAGDSRNGFCYEVLVRAHSGGVAKYDFEIADTDGELQRLTLNMSAGTAVDSQKVVLLLNAGGGAGTGGVNLITGAGTGSSSAEAHLVDKGINTDLPVPSNWRKKIGPGVNSELRTVGAGAPEGFSFSSVNTKEAIQAAFDTGDAITESEVIQVDDLFLVSKDGLYFLVKVNSVNETSNNNNDFYELEVKF